MEQRHDSEGEVVTIEQRVGDLFTAEDADALAHGCNCAGAMGRGIAVEFKRRWPDMYEEYRRRCKAGTFTPGECFPWDIGGRFVYNLGTQAHWRASAQLSFIERAVRGMLEHAAAHGIRRVAMPRIGAGLGGLSWMDVQKTIDAAADPFPVSIIVYSLD
jgi:O-acetyl-ADP-ribose deacetylase (regulator of RNase III)